MDRLRDVRFEVILVSSISANNIYTTRSNFYVYLTGKQRAATSLHLPKKGLWI